MPGTIQAMAVHLGSIPAAVNPLFNRQVFMSLPARTQQMVRQSEGLARQLLASSAPQLNTGSGAFVEGSGEFASVLSGVTAVGDGAAPPTTTQSGTAVAASAGGGASSRTYFNPSPGGANPPGTFLGPQPDSPGYGAGGGGWEQDARLNPIASLKRQTWPVHFLPGSCLTDSTGRGKFVMTPQEAFQGFRICFAADNPFKAATVAGVVGADGNVEQIVIGTRVVGVNPGLTPMGAWTQYSDAERFDLPFAPPDEEIIMQIRDATPNHTYYVIVLGYAPGCSEYGPNGTAMGRARMAYAPLGSQALNPGETRIISIVPQERFKPRRLVVQQVRDSDNVDALLIQQIQIGTRVESSQLAPHPARIWDALGADDWVDFDVCSKNSTIAVTVTNTDPSQTATFAGNFAGDVWYADEAGPGYCAPVC